MINNTLEAYENWSAVKDYESDEFIVTLLDKNSIELAEFNYHKFTRADFERYKNIINKTTTTMFEILEIIGMFIYIICFIIVFVTYIKPKTAPTYKRNMLEPLDIFYWFVPVANTIFSIYIIYKICENGRKDKKYS
ncbi:hypothetical protein [Tenacibaculum sp.]|uniref:hypothetical protein n=1 Tax=Tenacibaculum sp. TaxID=1906242 RepID=UPI003D12C02A